MAKLKVVGYCIKSPNGEILTSTFNVNAVRSWAKAVTIVATRELEEDGGKLYPKILKDRGYVAARMMLMEVAKGEKN